MPFNFEPGPQRWVRIGVWSVLAIVVITLGVWAFNSRSVANQVTAAANAVRQAIAPSAAPPKAEATTGAESSGPSAPARPAVRPRAVPARPPATSAGLPASVVPAAEPVSAASGPDPSPSGPPPILVIVPPTYDATNAEVMPPRLLTPTANSPLRTETRRSASPAAIEIIVNEDGSVESVRSTTKPVTLSEALRVINGLSIAMTWRFGPAKRNGVPVRYRLIVSLNTF